MDTYGKRNKHTERTPTSTSPLSGRARSYTQRAKADGTETEKKREVRRHNESKQHPGSERRTSLGIVYPKK